MKKQNEKLVFTKGTILELQDGHLLGVNGGCQHSDSSTMDTSIKISVIKDTKDMSFQLPDDIIINF